ncbi:unnamed protein product [Bursaphelenchus okinawaensis]|uniref:Uncharacterized protein n=1 Tax=Bursaphelenchus okinawaensis TaxID=465554 RepID=A0A811KJ38_9BILA|nr:unnamed protein product [Bursaphelenchus okinawaensis]CAG9103918.1 unnamed protein product [Bursaphelenchus okinawaensis]
MEFKAQFDKLVRNSRLDLFDTVIKGMINNLCSQQESAEAMAVLEKFRTAVEKTKQVTLNLNNDEKDKLNAWNNLNDSAAEENFYTQKMKELPPEDYKNIKKAYSKILENMFNSNLPEHYNQMFSQLSEKDFDQLRLLAKEEQKEGIKDFVLHKSAKLGLAQSDINDLFDYFTNSFKLVTLKEGSGTRQYQYRPEDNDDSVFWT